MRWLLATISLLLCASTHQPTDMLVEYVDLVEINHLYNEEGRATLRQVIWYDFERFFDNEHFCDSYRFQVVDWRLVQSDSQLPRKNWVTGKYETIWHDPTHYSSGRSGVLRKVIATQRRETWTTVDPEMLEREWLPKDNRRQLKDSFKYLKKDPFAGPADVPPELARLLGE